MSENTQNNNQSTDSLEEKPAETNDPLAQCEKEKQEYLAGWQRAKADHINYRKDEAKRFEDTARFVTAGLIQDVLPVLDSFDLALPSFASQNLGGSQVLSQDAEKGVLLIKSQLCDILKKRGLEEIKVSPGDQFDPEKHESVGEAESEYPAGTIAEEMQKGYYFQSRVLRPVRVRLVKSK